MDDKIIIESFVSCGGKGTMYFLYICINIRFGE